MNYVTDFFTNYILVCAFSGWFGAQFIKCIRYIVRHKSFNFAVLMASGGMPSSHSATVCALVVATAKLEGTKSVAFALAFVLAFIVMYDAAGVRRAAGEQAKVLNRIVRDIQQGETRYLEKNLKELIGHTPLQVFMGALLGIVIPLFIPVF
ncbi:MAG: divergent PAP2 family protein [Ruminococcaceae bacterium]|nr:divergent PAP2 family protein [Oscillospiraceae bacterium]